jgi:hypothetical protein
MLFEKAQKFFYLRLDKEGLRIYYPFVLISRNFNQFAGVLAGVGQNQ